MKKKTAKTFREQVQEAWLSEHNEITPECLDEMTTPAAEACIKKIRQWPGQYPSANSVVQFLLEHNRWDGNVLKDDDCNDIDYRTKKPYPYRLPLAMACDRFMYGDQRRFPHPYFAFADKIKFIPDSVTDDWKKLIRSLFWDYTRRTEVEVKILCLGLCVVSSSFSNPHAIARYETMVGEWKDIRTAIDAYCEGREGWNHLTTKSQHEPKRKSEFSNFLEGILMEADRRVAPSYAALKNQERRLKIGNETSRAINNLQEVEGFFQEYPDYATESIGSATKLRELIELTKKTALDAPLTKPEVPATIAS